MLDEYELMNCVTVLFTIEHSFCLCEQDRSAKSLVLPTTVKQGVSSDDVSCHEQYVRCINSLSFKIYRHYSLKTGYFEQFGRNQYQRAFRIMYKDYNRIQSLGVN